MFFQKRTVLFQKRTAFSGKSYYITRKLFTIKNHARVKYKLMAKAHRTGVLLSII